MRLRSLGGRLGPTLWIQVRHSKFDKGRDVAGLRVDDRRAHRLPAPAGPEGARRPPCLFVSLSGHRGSPTATSQTTFHNAVLAAGSREWIEQDEPPDPTTCATASRCGPWLGWYRSGLDVEALLPRLSTYLGHREPRFTYRYLSATPELLGGGGQNAWRQQTMVNGHERGRSDPAGRSFSDRLEGQTTVQPPDRRLLPRHVPSPTSASCTTSTGKAPSTLDWDDLNAEVIFDVLGSSRARTAQLCPGHAIYA